MGVDLSVGGQSYGGWKSMQVMRSIKALAGGFTLGVTDNWTGSGPLIIRPGDLCELKIGGKAIITGYVDTLSNALDAGGHAITVAGRDKTADLVDCSAVVGQGEILNQDLAEIARAMAKPFGVEVKTEVAAGAAFTNFSIQPGETVFNALDRAAKLRGLLFTSDGTGALVLTRIGVKRASGALIEGKNIKQITLSADVKERFSEYVTLGQSTGTDENHGAAAAHVKAEARDATVSRYRPLVVVAEDQANTADALLRAEWEAMTRAANSSTVQVTVQGFEQQDGGPLWAINELVALDSPTMGLKQAMLVSEIVMQMSENGGRETQLTLVRPDAFMPEPVVKKQGEPLPEGD